MNYKMNAANAATLVTTKPVCPQNYTATAAQFSSGEPFLLVDCSLVAAAVSTSHIVGQTVTLCPRCSHRRDLLPDCQRWMADCGGLDVWQHQQQMGLVCDPQLYNPCGKPGAAASHRLPMARRTAHAVRCHGYQCECQVVGSHKLPAANVVFDATGSNVVPSGRCSITQGGRARMQPDVAHTLLYVHCSVATNFQLKILGQPVASVPGLQQAPDAARCC
jgi:hypothetical protein